MKNRALVFKFPESFCIVYTANTAEGLQCWYKADGRLWKKGKYFSFPAKSPKVHRISQGSCNRCKAVPISPRKEGGKLLPKLYTECRGFSWMLNWNLYSLTMGWTYLVQETVVPSKRQPNLWKPFKCLKCFIFFFQKRILVIQFGKVLLCFQSNCSHIEAFSSHSAWNSLFAQVKCQKQNIILGAMMDFSSE